VRIVTAREQVEMLEPWRTAMPMLYHRTEPEYADSIYKDKEFGGPEQVWFSDHPKGENQNFGKGVVQLNFPDDALHEHGDVEEEFPHGEKFWQVPLDHIKPEYFVPPGPETH